MTMTREAMTHKELYDDAVLLLQALVRTPSFSREEAATALLLENWLSEKGIGDIHRTGNNVWARNLHFDAAKPTILLCSHHDTVKPNPGYTRDPFDGAIEKAHGSDGVTGDETGIGTSGGTGDETGIGTSGVTGDETGIGTSGGTRLWGLGSNDAGASVVSLAAAFRHFYDRRDMRYNLILALVGEEEISGPGGVRSILHDIGLDHPAPAATFTPSCTSAPNATTIPSRTPAPNISGSSAIVGEPTGMQMAIAEKGLLVLDCVARGTAGHAARDEGDNAIYRALRDIEWFRTYRFPRTSPLFGDVKMSVTMISAGTAHNVVPAECRFTVDCRVTEQYTNEQVLETVRAHVESDVSPRSMHLRPSSISPQHPIVVAGVSLGLSTFGSPTTSDQVALDIPSVKIGPGRSARSHSADEYVELAEIEQGIETYIELLSRVL